MSRDDALKKLRELPAFPDSLLAATSLPDVVEQAEDAAERRYEEMTEGMLPGEFLCGCGRIGHMDTAMPGSVSPWADPICSECYDEYRKDYGDL